MTLRNRHHKSALGILDLTAGVMRGTLEVGRDRAALRQGVAPPDCNGGAGVSVGRYRLRGSWCALLSGAKAGDLARVHAGDVPVVRRFIRENVPQCRRGACSADERASDGLLPERALRPSRTLASRRTASGKQRTRTGVRQRRAALPGSLGASRSRVGNSPYPFCIQAPCSMFA